MDPEPTTLDPATGKPLPQDAIQRVLFLSPKVHVYNIPPLTSAKGHTAAHWTDTPDRLIFTARARILETAWEDGEDEGNERLKVDVLLEDASTGQLFAAAPYTEPGVVESVLDSSRFFALRVRDPEGRKAILGIGFEERAEAFDFGVALQEGGKSLGFEGSGSGSSSSSSSSTSRGGFGFGPGGAASSQKGGEEKKRDYSLKEGETITVQVGKLGRRRPTTESASGVAADAVKDLSSFSLPPPPSSGSGSLLPPPPSSTGGSGGRPHGHRRKLSAQELGFDDGKNGEFA